MDPPLRREAAAAAAFSAVANPTSSYTLAEIWPLAPIDGGNGGLGLRMGKLGGVGGFGESDGSPAESTVMEPSAGGNGRKRRDFSSEDESSKMVSTTSSGGNELHDSNGKRMKTSGSRNENGNLKAEIELVSATNNKSVEQTNKPSEPPKQDYIHVRARRGQATDSHSLAERARREKISERMKILQDLVPGCNKVIGKAFVLDEIINYIQSLQQQVEFLSMKLEAINSRMNMHPLSIASFHPKDVGTQPFDVSGMIFGPEAAREYAQGSQTEWLHMQVGRSFERAT